MSIRMYLDDINQSWVSLDMETKIISANSYIRDLQVGVSISNAVDYWKSLKVIP